jgi:hypothetical protein
VSPRPLVFVSGLTVGDYLLWNWSLNTNHDVLALISGLTLPPLLVVGVWTLGVWVARLVASATRRVHARPDARHVSVRSPEPVDSTAPPASAGSSRKIAA